jgi:diguanylate cyclase (GGDEF)-like protein/PAS domain S-box-containing protein
VLLGAVLGARYGGMAQSIVAAGVTGASLVAIATGIRRHRPQDALVWQLFGAALVAVLCNNVAKQVTGNTFGVATENYPTWPDLFDVLVVVIGIAALARMVRSRRATDPTTLLDAVIISLATTFLLFAFAVIPELDAVGVDRDARSLNLFFAGCAIVLVGLVIRLAVGPGVRNGSYYLLATMGGFYALVEVAAQVNAPAVLQAAVSAASVVPIGAAALHPGMQALSSPAREQPARLTWHRMLTFGICAMTPLAVLVTSNWTVTSGRGLMAAGAAAAIGILIMVRLSGLVRVRERLSELDQILAQGNAEIARAVDRQSMLGAALNCVINQLGARRFVRAATLAYENGRWHVEQTTATVALRGEPLIAPETTRRLAGGEVCVLHDHRAVDGRTDRIPVLTLLPLVAGSQLRGAVAIASRERLKDDEMLTIEALAINLALALEAALLTEQIHRQRSERRFHALVEQSYDIVMTFDEDGHTTFVSPAGPRFLGRTEEELLRLPVHELTPEEHRDTLAASLAAADGSSHELELLAADGTRLWFEVSVQDLRDDPEIQGRVMTAHEATKRKAAERQLVLNEARFRSLVQNATDIVSVISQRGTIEWVTPSVERILGYSPDELLGQNVSGLALDPLVMSAVQTAASDRDSARTIELQLPARSGENKTFEVTMVDLTDDPSVGGLVVTLHEVTERRRLEESLRHQALHDDLTALPNRILFNDRVQQALGRRSNQETAVVLIDLDDFRTVNDGLGHAAGDELLKVLAFRLRQFLRTGDTAARLGGDEFGVLIDDVTSREDALLLAERLHDAMTAPVEMADRELVVGATMGIVFAGDLPERSADVILQCADVAMYAAKAAGKNRRQVFEGRMYTAAAERLELLAALAGVVERGELELWYQPIVDMADRHLVGFEALVRWRHPELGLISPALFVPLAEQTGAIIGIGRWVVEQAITQLAMWQAVAEHELTMEINYSVRQIEDDSAADFLAQVLADTEVPPRSIVIEMTESMAINDPEKAAVWLERFQYLGVGIYADDFGTGYGSYAVLQRLPFTGVKLDMSLVEDVDNVNRKGAAQVGAIVDMARRAGLDLVAEGVETELQYATLRDLGCRHGQGFLFGRPEPARAAAELVHALRATTAS